MREPRLGEMEEVVMAACSASAPSPGVYLTLCTNTAHRSGITSGKSWRWYGKARKLLNCLEGVWIPNRETQSASVSFGPSHCWVSTGRCSSAFLPGVLQGFSSRATIRQSLSAKGQHSWSFCLKVHVNRGDLWVLWLDLANVYGSIRHRLLDFALHCDCPQFEKELILDYNNNFRLRVTSGEVTSDWHQLEKGIITGCTISVILFALRLNMQVTTMTSVPEGRWILQGLEGLIMWPRMSFKPTKSKSIVLNRWKVFDKLPFSWAETATREQPVKSVGKLFDASLKDTAAMQKSNKESWLTKVNMSGLPGRFKPWIQQHDILPCVLCLLLVYSAPNVESTHCRTVM